MLIKNEHKIEHEIELLLSRLDSKLNHAYTVAQDFANESRSKNPDFKVARNVFHHLLIKNTGKGVN